MLKTNLYDANHILVKELGAIPIVPMVGEQITLAEKGKYVSSWVVVKRNFIFDPEKQAGIAALQVAQLPVGKVNTTEFESF